MNDKGGHLECWTKNDTRLSSGNSVLHFRYIITSRSDGIRLYTLNCKLSRKFLGDCKVHKHISQVF